jgi:hypothetical protein
MTDDKQAKPRIRAPRGMAMTTEVTTTRKKTITLHAADIRKLLRVPDDAAVTFVAEEPGGRVEVTWTVTR